MKRAEQKELRRQEILNTALDLFIARGYAATKTKDIAKAARMSEGLLFHYFETKEKLYLALIEIALSGKNAAMQLEFGDPIDFFQKAANMVINYIKVEPFGAKLFVLMGQAQNAGALPDSVLKAIDTRSNYEAQAKLVLAGQRAGSIREGDPLALSLAFWLAIQGIAENIARHPELPIPEPEWIVDIIRNKVR